MAEFQSENSSVGEKKILFEDPMIYTIDNFVTKEECEHFVNTSRPKLQRALVSDKSKGMYSKGRTGSNAWLRHEHDEITTRVGKRIAEQINIPFENAEAYQIVHYNETEKYDTHFDAYIKDDSEKAKRCLRLGGNRIVTALVYLNYVEEGGGTRFSSLKHTVNPELGKLLIFHNTKDDKPHPQSDHAALPVIKGEKFAFNLWFREMDVRKPYHFNYLKDFKPTNIVEPPTEIKSTNILNDFISNNNNVININANNVHHSKISDNLNARLLKNVLTSNECNIILSKCSDGKTQIKNRISYWVQNDDTNIPPLINKFAILLNIDPSFFENLNIMYYPNNSDHGFHFDAFDMTTERGQKNAGTKGQRLYTFVGLLNENNDSDNGIVKFKNYDNEIKLNIGEVCLYKNVLSQENNFNIRNTELEYSITRLNQPKIFFYLYLREKGGNGKTLTMDDIDKIDNKLEELYKNEYINLPNAKESPKIDLNKLNILNNNAPKPPPLPRAGNNQKETFEESSNENFRLSLQGMYNTLNEKETFIPYDSFKFRRSAPQVDVQYFKMFNNIRSKNMFEDIPTLLNVDNLNKKYKFDEFNPVAVDNVFLKDGQSEIEKYFDFCIQNKKFSFGDKQSQRYKAYDEAMCRTIQFEMLPLIEKITEKKLKPSYTYLSCYVKDANLPAHTDRPECEFTVSFILNKPDNTYWPIYFDPVKQPIKNRGRYREYNETEHIPRCIPVDCNKGGLMIFNGTDHMHFREKLPHDFYNIVLLHYMSR